jgi:hypothetical protein
MPPTVAYPRTRRLLAIHLVVQLFLLVLLVYMALRFQGIFQQRGTPRIFTNSIIISVVIQLLAFWPIRRFAAAEARRELAAEAGTLSPEEHKGLRQKRLLGDFLKASVFLFFAAFIGLAPGVTSVMSIAFFSFILSTLCYFQCFNFTARRIMRG